MELASAGQVFRLWIVRADDWQPRSPSDVPPRALAVEPVEEAVYSQSEAAAFVFAFNEQMLGSDRPWWVVAVPVRLRFDGDACSGMPIVGHAFDNSVPGWVDPAAGSCA